MFKYEYPLSRSLCAFLHPPSFLSSLSSLWNVVNMCRHQFQTKYWGLEMHAAFLLVCGWGVPFDMNRSSLSSLQAALWLSPPPGETAAPNKQLQERWNKRVDYSEGKTGKLAQSCRLWERPQFDSLRSNILWLLKRGRGRYKENVRRESMANVIWVVCIHIQHISAPCGIHQIFGVENSFKMPPEVFLIRHIIHVLKKWFIHIVNAVFFCF